MNALEPRTVERLEYASHGVRLNIFQKVSVFALRLLSVVLLLDVADSTLDVLISRSRGYAVSWYYVFDPGAKYLVLGLLCLVFARSLGTWLGSGLSND